MRFTLTAIVGINPRFEFRGTQQAVWFRDGPFPMDPFGSIGLSHGLLLGNGQTTRRTPSATLLDLPIMLVDPAPHRLTAVPGGVVPDQRARP